MNKGSAYVLKCEQKYGQWLLNTIIQHGACFSTMASMSCPQASFLAKFPVINNFPAMHNFPTVQTKHDPSYCISVACCPLSNPPTQNPPAVAHLASMPVPPNLPPYELIYLQWKNKMREWKFYLQQKNGFIRK